MDTDEFMILLEGLWKSEIRPLLDDSILVKLKYDKIVFIGNIQILMKKNNSEANGCALFRMCELPVNAFLKGDARGC